jgi:hypothetical protein
MKRLDKYIKDLGEVQGDDLHYLKMSWVNLEGVIAHLRAQQREVQREIEVKEGSNGER